MVKDAKAVSVVLGQRTIERNQLFVSIAKSKLPRQHERDCSVIRSLITGYYLTYAFAYNLLHFM